MNRTWDFVSAALVACLLLGFVGCVVFTHEKTTEYYYDPASPPAQLKSKQAAKTESKSTTQPAVTESVKTSTSVWLLDIPTGESMSN